MFQIHFWERTFRSLFLDNTTSNGKVFVYKNVSTQFYELGSGNSTILVIPGLGQSLNSWLKIAKALSENFRVIILELPNRGKKQNQTKLWSEKEFANYVIAFINRHTKEKLILIGHSLGGKISALVATLIGKKIRYLILYAVGGVKTNLPTTKNVVRFLKHLIYPNKSNVDFVLIYKKISIPTLLIYGENDVITPVEIGKRISKLITNAKLKIVPNGTHLAHEEFSNLFINEIKINLFL